ncbi:MAG: hypothetical protein KC493_10140 [Bacteriovoracaceae bacterium]|nr:hypothetical protein [Bacteriovoracaceae bacterium]
MTLQKQIVGKIVLMMGDKSNKYLILSALAFLMMSLPLHAQTTAQQASQLNSSNYDRLIGAAIDEILPPPTNPDNNYAKYKSKVEKKLRGEANEELLVTLMAIGITYTPASSNELSAIISSGNTYLNSEKGAADASGILADGLDALYREIQGLDTNEKSVQLEVLRNYKESITILKTAISQKLTRYGNYTINQSQSTNVINSEASSYGRCASGSGPSQGVNNFLPRLTTLENQNQSSITALTNAIEAGLNDLSLSLTTTIAELDTLIADAATPPDDVTKLEQIRADKITKDEKIAENAWIQTCKTDITPYPSTLVAIKSEENTYMTGVLDSMNDLSGEVALPTMGSTYQGFDLGGICSSPPAGFSLNSYLNRMKSDCSSWISYYKSPYMIPPVATNSANAKSDTRYQTLSNCAQTGRTCDDGEFSRIANEMKSAALFPMGRLIVSEMIKQSIAAGITFYTGILNDPSYVDCEASEDSDIQKLYCYDTQRGSAACLGGVGIDCERAEVGYLFYKFKLDSEGVNVFMANNLNDGEAPEIDAEGFADSNGLGAPDTGAAGSVNGVSSISGSFTTNPGGGGVGTSAETSKTEGDKSKSKSRFLSPDTKSASISAKAKSSSAFNFSKRLQTYFKRKYVRNSKLKKIKSKKRNSGLGDSLLASLSTNNLEKLAGSYSAKEMLFSSYVPKGGRANEIKVGKDKHTSKLASIGAGSSGSASSGGLFGSGGLGKSGSKSKKKKKDEESEEEEANAKKIADSKNEKNKPIFNKISTRYQKSLEKLGLKENPLAGIIHSRKKNLFEIVSSRYKKTKIYHKHSHRP